MGLKVFNECCKNCLLSKDAIVSPKRVKEIIKGCAEKQTYFICHKSDDIVCKTYYDKLGHKSQMIRIAERLNCVEFIDQPKSEKLITYIEMEKKKL